MATTVEPATTPPAGRDDISRHLFADETALAHDLAQRVKGREMDQSQVEALARKLVAAVRAGRHQRGGIEEFMNEYALSSEEGVVLMCLAEALLRIPDAETADKLIADKIGGRDWSNHIGRSGSLFVNASSWGLMLTGRVIELGSEPVEDVGDYLKRLVSRSGEPIIRQAMRHAMRILGKQFVLGRTIAEALNEARDDRRRGYRFSFDMLGEAARTRADAGRYATNYRQAIEAVGNSHGGEQGDVFAAPSISVKLSALHPRYERRAGGWAMDEMFPVILELAQQAREHGLGLTIDAEEQDRLELSLDIFEALADAPQLNNWHGLGLAVQAYGKRALPVLAYLRDIAAATGRVVPLRLVKGAYWDSEIKWAQEQGLDDFPLFTRKAATDVSYLACAAYLLDNRDRFYPQFATHNAHSVASVHVMAGGSGGYEFQRLHGMGQALHEQIIAADGLASPSRIYAPVGSHEDLLAYLVRRLLENGANTSFVNRLADDAAPIDEIIADPVVRVLAMDEVRHAALALPANLFAPRRNSAGIALWDDASRRRLESEIAAAVKTPAQAAPIVAGRDMAGQGSKPVISPQSMATPAGEVSEASHDDVAAAIAAASGAQEDWDRLGGAARADMLEKASDLYEANRARLVGLMVREAGKTLDNAIADLREAVDFLRYYAAQAREHFAQPRQLPGPTGERNELSLHGRGVFACISPWNFPLAIFTGQVAAALAAGNAVIAKPAEQTPLVACEAVRLLHRAGVPGEVLGFLPGDGARIGKALLGDERIAGVAFTGSNETAAIINQALAARPGAIAALIAETGGMNAMIVDSSALAEQVVRDLVRSAFDSAGQRCSAARIAFIQDDVADRIIAMLAGATEVLRLGDPMDYASDIGPVIDDEARTTLLAHKAAMARVGKTVIDQPVGNDLEGGYFVTPAIYELSDISPLEREVFGPILHVVRYTADRLDAVCAAINATGYGLTLGVHTRIESTAEYVASRVHAGNIYVNRNQIGAVVGAQPFGGEGKSGTGPKAGGPHYLTRFATERVVSTDTTASGGNATLMALSPG